MFLNVRKLTQSAYMPIQTPLQHELKWILRLQVFNPMLKRLVLIFRPSWKLDSSSPATGLRTRALSVWMNDTLYVREKRLSFTNRSHIIMRNTINNDETDHLKIITCIMAIPSAVASKQYLPVEQRTPGWICFARCPKAQSTRSCIRSAPVQTLITINQQTLYIYYNIYI